MTLDSRVGGIIFPLVPFVDTIKRNDRWFPVREWRHDVATLGS